MAKTKITSGVSGLLRKTMKISIIEGAFAQIYMSLSGPGSVFITRFAVLLNASPFHFGLLSAIGQLSQVFQPIGAIITRPMTSRKGMVLFFALTGRLMTLFLGILPFILFDFNAMALFLGLFFVSTTLQAIAGNAWIAWISDSFPLRIRGRFFSVRSRYLLIIGLLTGLLAAGFIDGFEKRKIIITPQFLTNIFLKTTDDTNLATGFLLLFSFATLIGVVGISILKKQPENHKSVETESLISMFSVPFKDGNFLRLLLFTCWWMLAVGIGAPFWQPFMLNKLQMSLSKVQFYGVTSTIAQLVVLKKWGKFIDRFGNKTAMAIAILLGGFNPMVWLVVSPSRYWLVYFEAVTSGIMWAGAGIVAVNFVLALAPDKRRQVYSGIHGAVSGLAMMFTMILSGWLLPYVPMIYSGRFAAEQVLFGMTGLFRWSALIPLLLIHDVRAPKLNEMIIFFRQYSKVRMTQLADRMFRYLPFISGNQNSRKLDD
ncbi:MAG: MFS transporter [bacterium]